MVSDPIGTSKGRYREKVEGAKEDSLGELGYYDVLGVQSGRPYVMKIPVISVPHIEFGEDRPGVGAGEGEEGDQMFPEAQGDGNGGTGPGAGDAETDPTYGYVSRADLVRYMRDELELDMTKPGAEPIPDKITFPYVVKHGSRLHFGKTITRMTERQLMEARYRARKRGEAPQRSKPKLEPDDLRYRHPRITYRYDKDAVLIHCRDVSGSVEGDELEASYLMSALTNLWLQDRYPKVKQVFAVHQAKAWEETEEGYYSLEASGGTRISTLYELLDAMFHGRSYETKQPLRTRIDPLRQDVYMLQMGDLDNWGHADNSRCVDILKKLMPSVTRLNLLYTNITEAPQPPVPGQGGLILPAGVSGAKTAPASAFETALQEGLPEYFSSGAIRVYHMSSRTQWRDAMRTFYGKAGIAKAA